ncbi:MAG: Exonuclease VII, small subunit [Candidatus Curtissbacteria bacterium GW2011_GWA1_41_11]|uniref:Exodeoxyribonuclease 7 small subunit n=1 Tax=Candidatus Curtissbacteria bacterium GW2011_GWA1_41_11 TaxID=1618409 RepID=A0A0G0UGL2_9BACT|nr:MAG: Exonuclease VII, small subunit [Candidatus Curtissbacteria bacterium GW2011_GWA1_41_11]
MAKYLNFTKALARLEEIVEKLEADNLDLDEAMKLTEEGFALHKSCQEKLKTTQDRIEKIISSEEVN